MGVIITIIYKFTWRRCALIQAPYCCY